MKANEGIKKENLKYQCCFCGDAILAEPPDPILIEIKLPDNAAQGLTAHRKCITKALHPSVPLGIEETE